MITCQISYISPTLSVASAVSDCISLPEVISFAKIRGSYASVHGNATSATIGTAPFLGTSLYDYPLGYGNNCQLPQAIY